MSAKVMSIDRGEVDRRNSLVLSHLDLVDAIVRQVQAKLPPCFEANDLRQNGVLGLMQAAAEFDPGRGVAFGAYARKRIKGQMIESVRKRNWLESTRQPIAEHGEQPGEYHGHNGAHSLNETSDSKATHAIEANLRRRQQADLLNQALQALPRREAIVIEMFYYREMEIQEIAQTEPFQVTPPRVSQLHSKALRTLRREFGLRGAKAA